MTLVHLTSNANQFGIKMIEKDKLYLCQATSQWHSSVASDWRISWLLEAHKLFHQLSARKLSHYQCVNWKLQLYILRKSNSDPWEKLHHFAGRADIWVEYRTTLHMKNQSSGLGFCKKSIIWSFQTVWSRLLQSHIFMDNLQWDNRYELRIQFTGIPIWHFSFVYHSPAEHKAQIKLKEYEM